MKLFPRRQALETLMVSSSSTETSSSFDSLTFVRSTKDPIISGLSNTNFYIILGCVLGGIVLITTICILVCFYRKTCCFHNHFDKAAPQPKASELELATFGVEIPAGIDENNSPSVDYGFTPLPEADISQSRNKQPYAKCTVISTTNTGGSTFTTLSLKRANSARTSQRQSSRAGSQATSRADRSIGDNLDGDDYAMCRSSLNMDAVATMPIGSHGSRATPVDNMLVTRTSIASSGYISSSSTPTLGPEVMDSSRISSASVKLRAPAPAPSGPNGISDTARVLTFTSTGSSRSGSSAGTPENSQYEMQVRSDTSQYQATPAKKGDLGTSEKEELDRINSTLPTNWVAHVADGVVYYYNLKTKESSWTRPE